MVEVISSREGRKMKRMEIGEDDYEVNNQKDSDDATVIILYSQTPCLSAPG